MLDLGPLFILLLFTSWYFLVTIVMEPNFKLTRKKVSFLGNIVFEYHSNHFFCMKKIPGNYLNISQEKCEGLCHDNTDLMAVMCDLVTR